MKSLLEELWYGNLSPYTTCRTITEEEKQLLNYSARHHDNLQKTLTESQKSILNKYTDCCEELQSLRERTLFVYAFRLGARMAAEVLCPDTD